MPDQQPAASENTPVTPRDGETAANVLAGGDGMGPGGGGLGPRSAANPSAGQGAPMGTAPNAAIDIATPDLVRAEASEPEEPRADVQARAEEAVSPTEPESDMM